MLFPQVDTSCQSDSTFKFVGEVCHFSLLPRMIDQVIAAKNVTEPVTRIMTSFCLDGISLGTVKSEKLS
jgi:hypothetical protein